MRPFAFRHGDWKRAFRSLSHVLLGTSTTISEGVSSGASSLNAYIQGIDRFNATQANAAFLDSIRKYNHQIIDALNEISPIQGLRLLDVGASPHGYALERALTHSVGQYIGIGLDITEPFEITTGHGAGKLIKMNAENLSFEDDSFDAIVSMSTFEHISNPGRALDEFRRVLRPGGRALISFEPIWTCSYGHHLHHFGPISALIPDWAHLLWTRGQMIDNLKVLWPSDAPITIEKAVAWTYDEPGINRIGIPEMRRIFSNCGMSVEWIVPLRDEARSEDQLRLAASATGLSSDDLMTKGLSVFLSRSPTASS